MNIELLNKICDTLRDDKNPFDMGCFFERDNKAVCPRCAQDYCGTACCIAGYALKLQYPNGLSGMDMSFVKLAARALLISNNQAFNLFFTENWPENFREIYRDGDRHVAAIKRIEHFIATDGRE